jgi:hypothetical protein
VSDIAFRQLEDAQTALSAALVANDIDTLQQAGDALAEAVAALRTVEGWGDRPGLRDDLLAALATAEASRGVVNQLADRNRRQLDRLIGLAGQPRAEAYGRAGMLR